MRRYDIVSGTLLIFSIIDFALAAPVLVQENCHADMVHIPQDETTMLGKRTYGTEELEEFIKSLEIPGERPDWHEPSSSAPAGPDHAPPRLAPAGPEPPDHAPPSSWPGQVDENPPQLVKPLETGSSTPADPGFDWEHWQNKVNEEDLPSVQPHDNPEIVSLEPDSDFDWEHWQKKVNEEDPPPVQPHDNPAQNVHQPERGSQAPDLNFEWEPHFNNWMALKNALSPVANWVKNWAKNLKPTSSGSDPYMMTAHQPLLYPLSLTDQYDSNLLSLPTEEYSYSYPGSRLPTVPEHKVVTSPSPGIGSSTDAQHRVVISPSPGIGSSTDAQHEMVGPPSLDLEPLKEPENELLNEPPTSPEGYPSSITNSQPVDPQALTQGLNYVLKGKAKVSDATKGPWNTDQSEFEPA